MIKTEKDKILLILSVCYVFIITLMGTSDNNFMVIAILVFPVALYWFGRFITIQRPPNQVMESELPDSLANELAKLAYLKEKGIITEDEFLISKRKLLNQ